MGDIHQNRAPKGYSENSQVNGPSLDETLESEQAPKKQPFEKKRIFQVK